MLLLLDIGNTHTHLGLANDRRVLRQAEFQTKLLGSPTGRDRIRKFVGSRVPTGAVLCSVVPRATPRARHALRQLWKVPCLELTPDNVTAIGIDYPLPRSIGPDRLANAIAARHHFGAPSVVVDFGTAVTFDVVDRRGNYVGGIIAPGLSAMTDYLHEKTALLPHITIREVDAVIGKNTRQAMLIGAVHGYRGLIKELIAELKLELHCRRLPVVATGGYARLIAAKLPEITTVEPKLTLEGLRLAWMARDVGGGGGGGGGRGL
jgi:type III pantothenate kinase